MHGQQKPARFLVEIHGEIRRFLIQRARPVAVASANALPGDEGVQRHRPVFGIEQHLPEIVHGLPSMKVLNIGKQFAVSGNEFRA